jgi:hypothetical protein
VPDDGDEGRLLKHLTIRAYRIIHGRRQGAPSRKFLRQKISVGGAVILADPKAKAIEDFTPWQHLAMVTNENL